jgi:hypothetical protein
MLRYARSGSDLTQRGAARVGIVWIVVVGVLFVAALAFGFTTSSDLAAERESKAEALASKLASDSALEEVAGQARDLTKTLGFYDEESTDPRSKLDLAKEEFANLRGVFTDLTEQDDRIDEMLPKIRAAYAARQRESTELSSRIQQLEAEAATREQTLKNITSEKDARIAELERQLADETQAAATRYAELERKVADATQQFSDRDEEFRRLQNEAAQKLREHEREKLALESRNGELASQLRFQRPPHDGYPDGKVLAVSDKLPLAWIDIGSGERVVPGLRFRVQSPAQGETRTKGWAEVTRVEEGMSEVLLDGIVDLFDPIGPGDVIQNPVFDPKGGRNAILVGRFTGQYSETELTQLLERMGVHVQSELDLTTTFMIVGSPLFNDPETGEPLEDPLEPSELAVYKEAEANSVQVIPLAEIREYFRVDLRTSQR